MKKIILTVAPILVAIITIAASVRTKHDVVVLKAFEHGQQTQAGFQFYGLYVYVTSASSNAIKFPNYSGGWADLEPLAEASAKLLDAGYELRHVSDNGLTMTFVR